MIFLLNQYSDQTTVIDRWPIRWKTSVQRRALIGLMMLTDSSIIRYSLTIWYCQSLMVIRSGKTLDMFERLGIVESVKQPTSWSRKKWSRFYFQFDIFVHDYRELTEVEPDDCCGGKKEGVWVDGDDSQFVILVDFPIRRRFSMCTRRVLGTSLFFFWSFWLQMYCDGVMSIILR